MTALIATLNVFVTHITVDIKRLLVEVIKKQMSLVKTLRCSKLMLLMSLK